MSPSDCPMSTSVGHFLDWRLIWEGPAHCGHCHPWARSPGLNKKIGWTNHGEFIKQLLPWPLLQYLPHVPALILGSELSHNEPVSQINSLLPKVAFVHTVHRSHRKLTRIQSKQPLSPLFFSLPYKVNNVYRFFMSKCIESPKVKIQGLGIWQSKTVTEACHMIVSSTVISVRMFQNFCFIHNISEESSISFLIVCYFGTSYDLFNLCKINNYRWLIFFL